jgi:hypothetical protein
MPASVSCSPCLTPLRPLQIWWLHRPLSHSKQSKTPQHQHRHRHRRGRIQHWNYRPHQSGRTIFKIHHHPQPPHTASTATPTASWASEISHLMRFLVVKTLDMSQTYLYFLYAPCLFIHHLLCVLFTLCGIFVNFPKLTYYPDATVSVPCFLMFLCFRKVTQEIFSELDETKVEVSNYLTQRRSPKESGRRTKGRPHLVVAWATPRPRHQGV